MSIRRFNFTQRKRIAREDVRCTLRRENGRLTFDADVNIEQYGFARDAQVWLEAQRGIERERFCWGTVARPILLPFRSLERFTSEDGISFRLVVSAPVATSTPNLILGEASNIRPDVAESPSAGGKSLLPVAVDPDLGQRLWRLDFSSTGPVLHVHPDIGGKAWAAGNDFKSAVLPACVRQVLLDILLSNMPDWPVTSVDEQDWRSLWLWWASALPGVSALPEDAGSYEQSNDWVETVIERFTHRLRARDLWRAAHEDDAQ